MTVWDRINQFAKELLGDNAPVPTDFSALEKAIIPEQGQRQDKTFTSWQAPMEDIEVLPEYGFILQALQAGCPSIFVTGKAGTGKSTLIQWLCQQLQGCAVVAPTAIAAVNVRGDTIHSFFGLPPSHIDPDGNFIVKDGNRLVLENVKFLIVDEVSMVLPNIVDAMSTILKKVRRNNIPFGGVPTNAAAKTINTRELDALHGELHLYEAVVTGQIPVNKWKLPVPDRLELKPGARVIFLKNSKPQWINGDTGEVVGLEADHIRVKKHSSDNVVMVGKETWYKLKYTYNHQSRKIEQEQIGTFQQFPIALGWAITIHKSQGWSFID